MSSASEGVIHRHPGNWSEDAVFKAPQLYDLAFNWDISHELELLLDMTELGGRQAPSLILVPACGTGRYARALAERGHEVMAFDICPAMIEFANTRHHHPAVRFHVDDMTKPSVHLTKAFDAAFLLCNSFRYILDPKEALNHLLFVIKQLAPGACYVLEMGMNYSTECVGQVSSWSIRYPEWIVRASWVVLSVQDSEVWDGVELRVEDLDGNVRHRVVEKQSQYVWRYQDFRELVANTGMEIAGVIDQDGATVENPHLPGRYYITLKKPGDTP